MLSSNTSAVSGDANYIEDVFSTYLYTATQATLGISNGIDLSTKGGLVLTKCRSYEGGVTTWTDTVRGATKWLASSNTNGENTTANTLTSFNTDGFTLGADTTGNFNYKYTPTTTYVSWAFRKKAKFFDIVTYAGNNSTNRTISHNLGSTPGCIIIKAVDSVAPWFVYHRSLTANYLLRLNTTAAATADASYKVNTVTSTTFNLQGGGSDFNATGVNYIAYVFAHDAGGFGLTGTDNVISCGSFTTDGSGRATVELGYEPQWLMQKSTGSGRWEIEDIMRGWSRTSVAQLMPNLSNAEEITDGSYFTPTATGFTTISAGLLLPSVTYIYIAIRRGPMKVPTDATKVLAMDTQTSFSANELVDSTFPPDMFIAKARSSGNTWSSSRITGGYLDMSATSAEVAGVWKFNGAGGKIYADTIYNGLPIYYQFQRAPSFFDEVCYTGTGTAMTVSHNLGVVPELMIVKRRDTARGWVVYSAARGATKSLQLQLTDAETTVSTVWNDTAPTSNVFTVGTNLNSGASGGTYVNYLFATCAGVSKVGSYTGTGTTQQINCGFAAGARFVLIKRTDSTGDWYVWDTARGIVSGNDPYLLLNSTAAETTSTDYIDTYSAGFELSSTAPAALNASGGTYIFLAIA